VLAQKVEDTDKRISRIDYNTEKIFQRLDLLAPAVARLEVKAGMWGAVGGLLAGAVMIGGMILKG